MRKINSAAVAEYFKQRSEIINQLNYLETVGMQSFYQFSLNGATCETITENLLEEMKNYLRSDLKLKLLQVHENLANLGIIIKE